MKHVHSSRAYEYLRQKILSGDYPPGFRLKPQELSGEIGISGTPIRDAMRQLEADGLVVIQPRLGAAVKSLDVIAFKELCDVRCALECLAAELAAKNRSATELSELDSSLAAMARIVDELKTGFTLELGYALRVEDIRFHMAILTAAQNETLYREVLRIHAVHRIISPKTPPRELPISLRVAIQHCHQRIADAIRSGDSEQARIEMREHIKEMSDRAVLGLAKSEKRSFREHVSLENTSYHE